MYKEDKLNKIITLSLNNLCLINFDCNNISFKHKVISKLRTSKELSISKFKIFYNYREKLIV